MPWKTKNYEWIICFLKRQMWKWHHSTFNIKSKDRSSVSEEEDAIEN